MPTLKQLRIAQGLTQKRLAELAGISEERVNKMENGASVQRDYVEKVLQVLGAFEEEVDGLKITRPLCERMNHRFTQGAVLPRRIDWIF